MKLLSADSQESLKYIFSWKLLESIVDFLRIIFCEIVWK